jgi:hypothetical protein
MIGSLAFALDTTKPPVIRRGRSHPRLRPNGVIDSNKLNPSVRRIRYVPHRTEARKKALSHTFSESRLPKLRNNPMKANIGRMINKVLDSQNCSATQILNLRIT